MTKLQQSLDEHGFTVLPGVLSPERVASLVADLERALPHAGSSVLRSRGQIYGVRNLIDVWPAARSVAQEAPLRAAVGAILGPVFGLVRSIFFDKPPGRTWSLPWHRDMTIAVRNARSTTEGFGRPTVKAGIPHLEAPAWLLREMLTARVALDDVTDENGPLLVIPGSHRDATIHDLPSPEGLTNAHPIQLRAGDILLIRPLVVHRSGPSRAGTPLHRRTLHFEFAPRALLPGHLEWHEFLRIEE